MNKELVSVIIPSFNRADTIKGAIESVLKQSYCNIEVIVVDDCSEDNTKNVIEAIKDPRVRYIRLKKNSGACIARNTGVKNAQGDIIAFQDSDDKWHEDKLEKQINYLKNNDYEFISCGFIRISGIENKPIGIVECPVDKIELWCNLINNNWVSTQTIVCYKYCFEKIHFDANIKRYQDWDLALQAAMYYKIGCLPEYLVDVYLQENSITNTVKMENAKLKVVEKHFVDVDISNKKMKAQYYKTLADVIRKRDSKKAATCYRKSFIIKPRFKILICWLGCVMGLFRFYNSKQ